MFYEIKKIVATLLCFALFVCFALNAFADDKEHIVSQTVEHYPDGTYAVITTYADTSLTRSNTKSGRKDYNYYDNSLAWTFTVYGTFSYNGLSATCTAASYNYNISNTAWRISSAAANPNGNSAVASGTFTRSSDNRTIHPKVTLTCSDNGQLS